MKASVIIPTYKRKEYLERCLESLMRQKYLPEEVIVVTEINDFETQAVIKKIRENNTNGYLIKDVKIDKLNIVYAENRGLKNAKGQIVCFIDDDACAPVNWIEAIIKHYEEDPKIGGVGGPVIPHLDGKEIIEYTMVFAKMNWYGKRITNSTKIPFKVQNVDFLRGANMSFRRNLIDNFDENLLPYWRRFEDDICLSIKEKGYKIICDPQIKVLHFQATENEKMLVDKTPETIIGLHHNSIYVKLKHIKGLRKFICIVYEFIWGDNTAPGCIQIILYGIKHRKWHKLSESFYALIGKLKGIQTYLRT